MEMVKFKISNAHCLKQFKKYVDQFIEDLYTFRKFDNMHSIIQNCINIEIESINRKFLLNQFIFYSGFGLLFFSFTLLVFNYLNNTYSEPQLYFVLISGFYLLIFTLIINFTSYPASLKHLRLFIAWMESNTKLFNDNDIDKTVLKIKSLSEEYISNNIRQKKTAHHKTDYYSARQQIAFIKALLGAGLFPKQANTKKEYFSILSKLLCHSSDNLEGYYNINYFQEIKINQISSEIKDDLARVYHDLELLNNDKLLNSFKKEIGLFF